MNVSLFQDFSRRQNAARLQGIEFPENFRKEILEKVLLHSVVKFLWPAEAFFKKNQVKYLGENTEELKPNLGGEAFSYSSVQTSMYKQRG